MPGSSHGQAYRIIGRDLELTAIRNALDEAGSGNTRVIVFGGPPGIGKTTLAEEACRLAEARSASVCWVRCSDIAPASSLWLWQRIVEQLAIDDKRVVLETLAEFARGTTEDPEAIHAGSRRFSVFEAVRRSFVDACTNAPTVVVIDNLQWADIASLDLFEYICQQARRLALLIVVTVRNVDIPTRHPVHLAVGEIEREAICEQFVLGGISRAETGELIRDRSGYDPTESEIDALHSVTEGNPLYLVEMAREVGRSDSSVLNAFGTGEFIRALPNLRGTILSRVSQLGTEVTDLLGTAALIGRDFPLAVLSSVAELPTFQANDLLAQAETAGLVRTNGGPGTWRFTHALVRDALTATVDDCRSGPVHSEIAQVLESYYGEDREEHAAEIARHFSIAATNRSREMEPCTEIARACFRYSVLAANQTGRSGDLEMAAAYYHQAIEHVDGSEDPTLIAHAVWRLALVEEALGRESAVDQFSRSFSMFCDHGDFETAVRCIASTHFPTSFLDPRPAELLEQILPKVSEDLPAAVLARVQIAARSLLMTGDYERYRDAIGPHLAKLSRLGAPAQEIEALSQAICIDFSHIRKCQSFYDRLNLLAETTKNSAAEILGLLNSSFFAYFYPESIAEARAGRRHIDAALFRAEQIRDHRLIAYVLMARARALFDEGRWVASEADLSRGITLYPFFKNSTPVRLHVLMSSERGDSDGVSAIVESRLADGALSRGINSIIELAWAIAMGALLRKDVYRLAEAREAFERIVDDAGSEEAMVWRALLGLGITAVAAGADDVPDIHARIVEFEKRFARTRRSNCMFRGIISAAAGDDARALELFEYELEIANATGARVMKVWTARFWAEAYLQRQPGLLGPPDRLLLRWAVDAANEVGMITSAGRLREAMDRFAQIDRKRPNPREFGLSPREGEVLRHIALGETNQEISRDLHISEHTVAHHVTRILEKIGVDNRTSAAALAVRNELTGTNDA